MGAVLPQGFETGMKANDPWLPSAIVLPTFLVAFATLMLLCEGHRIAIVWPANAVILALLLQTHVRLWWRALAAGALGLVLAAWIDESLSTPTLFLTACNILEISVCAALIYGLIGQTFDLRQPRSLLLFLAAAGVVAPLCSAVCAAWSLQAIRGEPFRATFATWYVGDALGLVVVTPMLLLISASIRRHWR